MSDALPPFGASNLKLHRAKRHLDGLLADVTAYLRNGPVRLVLELPESFAASGMAAWTARIFALPADDWATIIGDVVHNLRCALDLLATDIVRLNGASAKGVYFPFAEDHNKLEEQIKRKNVNRAHRDCVALIRSIKPYAGGNALLRGLHDLDIQDKHQALIPMLHAIRTPPMRVEINGSICDVPSLETGVPKDGTIVVMMPRPSNLALGMEMTCNVALVFHEDTPFPGQEIIPLLQCLYNETVRVAKAFQTLCEGQSFPVGAAAKGGSLMQGFMVPSPPKS